MSAARTQVGAALNAHPARGNLPRRAALIRLAGRQTLGQAATTRSSLIVLRTHRIAESAAIDKEETTMDRRKFLATAAAAPAAAFLGVPPARAEEHLKWAVFTPDSEVTFRTV